jgi:hypothetical protein
MLLIWKRKINAENAITNDNKMNKLNDIEKAGKNHHTNMTKKISETKEIMQEKSKQVESTKIELT